MDFIKVNKLLSSQYYAIPDYQRGYEWTNEHNATLLDDIFDLLSTNEKHFVGAIVTIPFDQSNSTTISVDIDKFDINPEDIKHIVDGQQRMTSISVLLAAIRDLINNDQSINEPEKNKLCQKISTLLLGQDQDDTYSNTCPRIILNDNTGRYYNTEIAEGMSQQYNKNLKGAKRMIKAKSTFTNSINEKIKDYVGSGKMFANNFVFYKELLKSINEKVEFVEIECSAATNAFQVFDSLNGKGLDLTAVDRIKNIFMSWCASKGKAQKWASFYDLLGEKYISSFFVALFFYSKNKRISKNQLPDVFSNEFKSAATSDFETFFSDLKNKAKMYSDIRNCKSNKSDIKSVLLDIKDLKNDQIYVMIYAIINTYNGGHINNKKLIECFESLISLIVRIQVCEKSTNRLDNLFDKYITELKENKKIENVTKLIQKDIKTIVPDKEFETEFKNFAPEDTTVSNYYLRKLENHFRANINNRDKAERNLTVEHIIPQTLDDKQLKSWYKGKAITDEILEDFNKSVVERIGNKALLFGDDNSSAGNNMYPKKILVYKNGINGSNNGTPYGTFELIKNVVDNYPKKFTHTEVEKRAATLAKAAVKIWK